MLIARPPHCPWLAMSWGPAATTGGGGVGSLTGTGGGIGLGLGGGRATL